MWARLPAMRAFVTAFCALVLGFPAIQAMAQEPPASVQAARESYAKAEAAMKQGDFALAAAEYARAYEHTGDPVLLFKIGNARHKAGDCEGAVTHYNKYLEHPGAASQDNALVAEARERLAACQGNPGNTAGQATASGDSDAEPVPAALAPAPAEIPPGSAPAAPVMEGRGEDQGPPSFVSQPSTLFGNAAWVSVGVSFTFVTAGAILAMSASSREEDIGFLIDYRYPDGAPAQYSGQTRERYEELIDEGERAATYSRIMFGAAGVAAITAGVLFALDARTVRDAAVSVVPTAAPHGIGMAAGWRF